MLSITDKEFHEIVKALINVGFYPSDATVAVRMVINMLPISNVNPDATPRGGGIEV